MKAIILAVSLGLVLSAQTGCATMTLEEAIAKKGLVGACEYLQFSGENYNAVDARVRTMFEKHFSAELRIERVRTRDANGKAVNPMKWGELIAVHWRIRPPASLPPGVTAYHFKRPRVWFAAPETTGTNAYIARHLNDFDAARMLTGKGRSFSGGQKSFWSFMKSVFVNVPALTISGGLIGDLGEDRTVSLRDAVLSLQKLVSRQCSYDPSEALNWSRGECSTTHAIVPEESGESPSYLYVKAAHGILDRNGRSCGLFSRGRLRLPSGRSLGERTEALFQGQWRPLTDFERVWAFEDRKQ